MSWVTTILSMAATACLTLAAMQFLVWFKPRMAWRKLLFSVTATSRQIHVPAWARLGSLGLVRLCLRNGGPWLALLCGVFALDAYAAKASIQKDPTYLIDTWETEDGIRSTEQKTVTFNIPDGAERSLSVDRSYFDTAEAKHTTKVVGVDVSQITCDGPPQTGLASR